MALFDKQSEGRVLGDILLNEQALNFCREEYEVTRVLAATEGLEIGRAMDEEAAAVAAVQTVTQAVVATVGTYRLRYKGQYTTALAFGATAAQINTALDVMILLTGGTAGDIIYSIGAGDKFADGGIFTFVNDLGNVPDIVADTQLLLTATGAEAVATIATTTAGELTANKMVAATTANADSILLEPVSLTALQSGNGQQLRRAHLVRGPSSVNVDQIFPQVAAGTMASLIGALEGLGIQCLREAEMTEVGLPTT